MREMQEDCYTFKPKSKRIIQEVTYEASKMGNRKEEPFVWTYLFLDACPFIRPGIPYETD